MKPGNIVNTFRTAVTNRFIYPAHIFMVLGILFLPLPPDRDAIGETNEPDPPKTIAGDLNGRTVRVGLYENKPKIFTDESGQPAGIFPVILNEIARREKWNIVYVPGEWDECLAALENGRIDLMPDVAFTKKRDEKYDFHTEPVVSSWSVVYAGDKRPIDSIADLNGLRIAVLKGSIQQTVLRQMAEGFGLNIFFVETKSFEEAFSLTARGEADAVVSNHFFGDYYHQQYGLERTPVIFEPISLYFAVASGANADLLQAVDKNLQGMKSQPGSAYYQALRSWIKQSPKTAVPKYVLWLLCGISGVLVFAALFIVLLRREVKSATGNLTHANEQLAESEKKFHDLFQKHTAVKLIINPANGAIVEANEAAERFYGWSREELLWMRIQDINQSPPERLEAEMEKAKRKKQSHFEFRHRLADGSIRDVEVFSSAIDIQGDTFLHSIIHDVTEKRKLEEQYRQSQKMESVGRLAGGIAHDYNNMLSVILGYTELAMDHVQPTDPLYGNLTEVLRAARQSADITRQLLTFARRQPVEPRLLDLNQSTASMLKMLQRLIGENIELIWKPGDEVCPTYMDPSQLDQILANLCTNARDAITGVGKIIVETGNVAFDEAYCRDHDGCIPGDFIMLALSDDGCGMDRETLNHIYEPFFTTKELGKGTGLGLATVYGIVKQNNGFINVYSEPGKGTTFRIYLPRQTGTIEGIEADREEDIPRGDGEMVLLVEDDPSILALGGTMLETLGYRVLTADTPSQAQRLAGDHSGEIDLLITDVVMPEMNGRELSDTLRALYPNLKVLFMSGYTADAITCRGTLGGRVNFMQKPFSLKTLAVKTGKALGKERESP